MNRFLPLYIGWRFTVSRREQKFISFVSLVSLLGLVLGVTAMVVVLSVMNGFDRELRQRILKVIPHGFVESRDGFANWRDTVEQLGKQKDVIAAAPLISGKALVTFNGRTVSVELDGIEPELEKRVSAVHENMVAGQLDALQQQPFGIVLGQLLARRLGVTTGDRVQVLLPQLVVTPAGVFTRQKSFLVVGVFRVGADPDNQLALVSLDSASRLFQQRQADKSPLVKAIQVRTRDVTAADSILSGIRNTMDPALVVSSWADTHRALFNAVKMEKRVISLLLFVVVAVAVFNITSILVMMVAEKRRDIAILRVMGADTPVITGSFMTQGLIVGLLGILVGGLLGSTLALYMPAIVSWLEATSGHHLFSPDVYYVAHMPSEWHASDVIMIVGVSIVLCVLATLYPALKSARIDPVHALND